MRSLPFVLALLLAACSGDDECTDFDLVGDDVDQNCDGVDGVDADQDGFAAEASGGTDCADDDAGVHPEADDVCNGVDDDCNGLADDGGDATTWFADGDGDGFGRDGDTVLACEAPAGFAAVGGDCDDGRAVVNPGAVEACNGFDDDCDEVVDGPGADGYGTWHLDSDGDGYGDPDTTEAGCIAPMPYVLDGTDCNDGEGSVNPGAEEICDGVDQDCDSEVDNGASDAVAWYGDADGDGWGDDADVVLSCDEPDRVATGGDCNDADPATHPGASEACGEGDRDCDTLTDEADPDVVLPVWYADADADGFGDPLSPVQACDMPSGTVDDHSDCDDLLDSTYPGASDPPGDGVDQDCDGFDDPDVDRDGFSPPEDCDDTDPNLSPTSTDLAGDGIDQNCDGVDGTDLDGDGVASELSGGADCDDADPLVNGEGAERLGDRADNDCDGVVDVYGVDYDNVLVSTVDDTFLGASVDAGDLDGDGALDVMVSSRGRSFYGPGGTFVVPLWEGECTEADATGVFDVSPVFPFWSGIVGDLDGDGLGELAAPGYFNGDDGMGVWFDPPVGLVGAADADLRLLEDARTPFQLLSGDFDGDTVTDLLVVLYREGGGGKILYGPFAPGTIDLVSTFDVELGVVSDPAESERRADVGDINDDGYDDVVFGSTHTGDRLDVFYGPFGASPSPDVRIQGPTGSDFGDEVRLLQLDADPELELAVASPGTSGTRGAVTFFDLPTTGLLTEADAFATVLGDVGDHFGHRLVDAGDVDGDGTGDLLVGTAYDGRLFLMMGPFAGSVALGDVSGGRIDTLEDGYELDSVHVLGDIDGSGGVELLVGQPELGLAASQGGAVLLLHDVW